MANSTPRPQKHDQGIEWLLASKIQPGTRTAANTPKRTRSRLWADHPGSTRAAVKYSQGPTILQVSGATRTQPRVRYRITP